MRRSFGMRRVEEPPQSDPRLMSPNQLRAYASAGGFSHITDLARVALGVLDSYNALAWPMPLYRRDLSCQTLAVVNGIRSCQAALKGFAWAPIPSELEEIRLEAGRIEGRAELFAAASIATLLVERGQLKSVDIRAQQPIVAAEIMASGGFTVATNADTWHATTIVPNFANLATDSGAVPQLVSIDSLNGQQTVMGTDEFCAAMLERWQEDEMIVCKVT